MSKKITIIGAGLGGLSAALRFASIGCQVDIIEKNSTAGGRLNQLKVGDFTFDTGPSFMSMTYELDELFKSTNIINPLKLIELEPLYTVFFENNAKPYKIFKNLFRLQEEFPEEKELPKKLEKFLLRAGSFFHDTEEPVIKSNFDSLMEYVWQMAKVPKRHLPYLFRTMWQEVDKNFSDEKVKIILSLVAFFLGSTPFQTPAIYSLLNYTEMKYNGYWAVEGGMYQLVVEIVKILEQMGVRFHYNTEIVEYENNGGKLRFFDQNGDKWDSDIFIVNSEAPWFRGKVMKRNKFDERKLSKYHWTLAPFTIYLGVKGKVEKLDYHNYFLGSNFKGYADKIFTSSLIPQKPYYYVNVLSKYVQNAAPQGHENLFILCPVPDLRYKPNWDDRNEIADNIISDLSKRVDFDLKQNTVVREIFTPIEWQNKFNLYKGSGLGLAHDIMQVGALRPKNKDEEFDNLYYVGASTTPGTGLPMVVISSKLVFDRVIKEGKI
mgnify:FL=1